MASPNKIHRVAILLFPGADILDVAGPAEILSNTSYNTDIFAPDRAFEIHFIASTSTIKAGNCMTVAADLTFPEASAKIDQFDVLVVPGAMPSILEKLVRENSAEVQFVKAFNSQPQQAGRKKGDERIILSVCTGALLLAATGALKNLKATTHHIALDILKQMDETVQVVSTVGEGKVGRYVDGGENEEGVRVVTAGGVTCGLDAALFVAELKVGRAAAEREAEMEEHEWKRV